MDRPMSLVGLASVLPLRWICPLVGASLTNVRRCMRSPTCQKEESGVSFKYPVGAGEHRRRSRCNSSFNALGAGSANVPKSAI